MMTRSQNAVRQDATAAAGVPGRPTTTTAPLREDSRLAGATKAALAAGDQAAARESFAALVALHQRRANRIAHVYLRDAAEADDAVQDAFVKVFRHLSTYREHQPFDVWFTRILVNACVDRQRSWQRRNRRLVPLGEGADAPPSRARSPEQRVLGRRWRSAVAKAVNRLPRRQRTVFVLCHYGNRSPREVSAVTGMSESTVRVHLFRAVRKLRAALEEWRDLR
jgi:RNA polymerase sigma-70 factor, ECF subfamily